MKFIVVTGGVLSGLGKGITSASIGLLLKSRGIKVTNLKSDMYLNIDAGTMNPTVHGEVFVTHDGLETDQDLGHYERFLNTNLTRDNYLTNGQLYMAVLEKERSLEYEGKCVEPYHHIPPEIIKRWYKAGKTNRAEVVIIELGGTVGEYEGLLFMEAARRLKLKFPKDVVFIHVAYLPAPPSIGELKSKPLQQSISLLNSVGIQPDFVVGRAEKEIDRKRKEKIALASGIEIENIVSNPDVDCIYEVPLVLDEQSLVTKTVKKLNLKGSKKNITQWKKFIQKVKKAQGKLNIAIVGKYQKSGDYTLEDSYVSVVEAIKHACWNFGKTPKLIWIDSGLLEKIKEDEIREKFSGIQGIIVPQGWGKRGFLGKIKAVNFARVNNIPYLGLCFGMQMAVIEFARNVLGLKKANSTEINPKTKYPVIHTMLKQKEYLEKKQYGGTIRLGAWPCVVKKGSKLEKAYLKFGNNRRNPWFSKNPKTREKIQRKTSLVVYERHRHRYEFNQIYRKRFEEKGFQISGISPDKKLVEAIEIKNHPFFIGTQFHPEYMSRPLVPHPVFLSFVKSIISDQAQ